MRAAVHGESICTGRRIKPDASVVQLKDWDQLTFGEIRRQVVHIEKLLLLRKPGISWAFLQGSRPVRVGSVQRQVVGPVEGSACC